MTELVSAHTTESCKCHKKQCSFGEMTTGIGKFVVKYFFLSPFSRSLVAWTSEGINKLVVFFPSPDVITSKWSLIYVHQSIIRNSHETELKNIFILHFPPSSFRSFFYAASENKKCRWLWKLWLYLRSSCRSFTRAFYAPCSVTMESILAEVCHLSQLKYTQQPCDVFACLFA
jgi:hypothetical protein